VPKDEIHDGQYYLLVDTQIRVERGVPPQYYHHYAVKVVNTTGLETTSQITFTIDPSYQKATLNTLVIIRQGQRIDMLPGAEIQMLRREKDLDRLLYDGRHTGNVIVKDVRIGDILEYAYTISGDNPIYSNLFSYAAQTQWSVPIHKHHFRLIWPKARPLYQKRHNTDVALTRRDQGENTIFSMIQDEVKPVRRNTQTPSWFQRYGYIQLSEMQDWASVVAWALPLYRPAYESDPGISKLADRIRKTGGSAAENVIRALNYVQNEIRYLGIEYGVNSHQPSPPQQTFERRYGDCKDKTVALISLLTHLGVQAYPALVHTRRQHEVSGLHPTIDAFNHVIAKADVDGRQYWLDPTRNYQGQSLDDAFQPDYGVALLVAPGETGLSEMPENDHLFGSHMKEIFDLRKGIESPVLYQVMSKYRGYNAEDIRSQLAEEGRKAVEEDYVHYYARFYEQIEKAEPIKADDTQEQNELQLEENYRINDFWEKDEDDGQWQATFHTNALYSYLKKPDQRQRHEPYRLTHPVNVRQTIRVLLPEPWENLNLKSFTEHNAHFRFTSEPSYDKAGQTLQLDYHYRSFKDHVSVEELADYGSAIDRVDAQLDYYLYKPMVDTASHGDGTIARWMGENIHLLLIIGLGLLFIYCLIEWWVDLRKPDLVEGGYYYCVPLTKLFILNLSTLGIYITFWFYQTWKYIKKRDDAVIMPFWRAIFWPIWFFPLYQDLKRDSEKRFGRSILPKSPLIALLLVLYIGLYVSDHFGDFSEMFHIFSVLCILPFANYINYINREDPKALKQHSHFRPRHYILTAMAAIFLVISIGSLLNWIPNGEVIKGHQLPSWDLKYMQRHGLVKGDAQLIYFYSDAFFFRRHDGNGVTDANVFSYWYDKEDGELLTETIAFEDIDDISVKYAKADGENTVITIKPKNGSSFILYVSSEKGKDKLFVQAIEKNRH
jgi:transglutaminase-like putative cysteine protease